MLKLFLNRRLGPVGIGVIVLIGVAAVYGLLQVLPKKEQDPAASATPTATATPCTPAAKPFGDPPDTFAYEQVDEQTRARTVKALKLDEKEGKVDMRKATRTGLTLGQLVAVPGRDPADYAASLVAAAQGGGAVVTRGAGYVILPLESGQSVAVGVRGCNTILINAQDPEAVKFLAANVFSAS